MRFIDVNPQNPFSKIYIEHRGEKILWNLEFYKRNKVTTESVFHYVNNYLAHLPEAKQGEIFALYQSMREQIDRVIDPNMLHQRLSQKVKELYKLIPFTSVQEYIHRYENILIPPVIKENYEDLGISERSQNYREQTYLRADYRELVDLAVYLRFMIPIWAEFAEIVDRKHKNHFREYRAMALLNQSAVMKTRPMERLRNYIEKILDAEQQSTNRNSNMLSAVLGGLGSSEMPDWMLSAVVIRRLVTIELSSIENSSNVVSKVYRYITNQNRSINRKFSGVIKDKHQDKINRNNEDGEKFIIETYKIKQELSDGDLAVLSIYAENPHAMIARIDPEVPPGMVTSCFETLMQQEEDIEFSYGQLTILRWIMAPIMPPRSIENLKKRSLIASMAVAQATLWYREYYDLAKLLTAQRLVDEHGFLIGGSDSYRRIPKELIDQLEYHFPFSGERNEKDRSRQTNVAIRTIDRVTRDFVRSDWSVIAPDRLIPMGTPMNDDGSMVAPQYLRVQLAQYILESAQAQQNQQQPIWDAVTTL